MAKIEFAEIRPSGTIEGKVDALYDAYFMMRKQLTYYLSGVLDSDNIQSITTDLLIAGTAKISTAFIEDLEVGSNVTMGPDATISWGNVTGAPSIPTLPGYITSTKITSTTIESPSITGGTLTGGTVRTAASGERLSMNSSGLISYNSSGNKSGIAVENGDYGYSELNFYQNGMAVGQLMYNSLGELSLSGLNDVVMYPGGTWNFSRATVTGLDDVGGVYNFVFGVGGAILAESSLSFLGLGILPPDMSWGGLLSDGKDVMDIAWWVSFFPGLMIFLVTFLLVRFAFKLQNKINAKSGAF